MTSMEQVTTKMITRIPSRYESGGSVEMSSDTSSTTASDSNQADDFNSGLTIITSVKPVNHLLLCFPCCQVAVTKDKKSNAHRQDDYTTIIKGNSVQRNSTGHSQFEFPLTEEERRGMCGPFSWSVLPILVGITASLGFIATYFFAKSNCHIQRWILPYLSYTGTEYPESMIFGLILNAEGFLGMIVVFLAWRYYRHLGQQGFLNMSALLFGSLSCFGVILVGNFQVTRAKIPHYIGAGSAFINSAIYGVLTSILSRRVFRQVYSSSSYRVFFCLIRLINAIVMIISMTCFAGVVTYKLLNEKKLMGIFVETSLSSNKDLQNQTEIDISAPWLLPNGTCKDVLSKIPLSLQYLDLVGSVMEWILTGCMLFCLSLFAYEFKSFQNVKIVLLTQHGALHRNSCRCEETNKYSSKNARASSLYPSPPLSEKLDKSKTYDQLFYNRTPSSTDLFLTDNNSKTDGQGVISYSISDKPYVFSPDHFHATNTDSHFPERFNQLTNYTL